MQFSERVDTLDIKSEISEELSLTIPNLENAALISVLEDAIDQVIILGSSESYSDLDKAETEIESLKCRAAKYSKNDPVFNCLNGEIFELTLNKMKFLKLHQDRSYLEQILTQTRDELYEINKYESLNEFLRNYHEAETEEENLINDESYNKSYASALKATVKRKAEDSQREIKRINEKIAKCKDEMESYLFDNALKIRYLENFENARIEQGYMLCDQNEQELTDTINKYKNEIEKEIRINAEIQTYIAENQKDMEESIENWMTRYDTELEEKQIQIQLYKDKREEQKKRYDVMFATFHKHTKEIADWLEYREKKRIQDEIDAIRYKAATKIQAWWRGMMFRHQLGPWNPEKPLKKKKDKIKKRQRKRQRKRQKEEINY